MIRKESAIRTRSLPGPITWNSLTSNRIFSIQLINITRQAASHFYTHALILKPSYLRFKLHSPPKTLLTHPCILENLRSATIPPGRTLSLAIQNSEPPHWAASFLITRNGEKRYIVSSRTARSESAPAPAALPWSHHTRARARGGGFLLLLLLRVYFRPSLSLSISRLAELVRRSATSQLVVVLELYTAAQVFFFLPRRRRRHSDTLL